jgi:hypothetical protein
MPLSAAEWAKLPELAIQTEERIIQVYDLGVYFTKRIEQAEFKKVGYRSRHEPDQVALPTAVVEEGDRLTMYRLPKGLARWAYRIATSTSVRGRFVVPASDAVQARLKRPSDSLAALT